MRDVLSELVKLRDGYGITFERVKDSHALCTLRVVDAEFRREGRFHEDIFVTAYDVLLCMAKFADVLGPEYQQIIFDTLNFSNLREHLGQRRNRLMDRLEALPETYKDMETRAYSILAGQLLMLRRSPCSPMAQRDKMAERARREWQQLNDRDAVAHIEMALARLRQSRSPEEADEAARRIFEKLPRASNALRSHGLSSDSRGTMALIERLAATGVSIYQGWSDVAFDDYGIAILVNSAVVGLMRFAWSGKKKRSEASCLWRIEHDWVTWYDLGVSPSVTGRWWQEAGIPARDGADTDERIRLLLNAAFSLIPLIFVALEHGDNWSDLWPPGRRERVGVFV